MLPNKPQTIRRHCDSSNIYHSPTNQKKNVMNSVGWEKCRWRHTARNGLTLRCERPEATFFVSRILTQDVLRISSFKYGKMIFHKSPIIIRWLESGRYWSISHFKQTRFRLNYSAIRTIRELLGSPISSRKKKKDDNCGWSKRRQSWTEINEFSLICFDVVWKFLTEKRNASFSTSCNARRALQ